MKTENNDRQIWIMAMKDTVHSSFIALPIISLFEIIMIARWCLTGHSLSSPEDAAYLAGYIALLGFSLVMLAIIRHLGKDVPKHYRGIHIAQFIYAVAIVLWTLEVTYAGCLSGGYFDYLVYVTIIIIVPIFCFLSPSLWVPVQILSSVIMLHFASGFSGFHAFIINFSVFTIISIVASWRYYRIRFTGYQRQIELQNERDLTRHHAYHDALTDLPNRRSYIEDLDRTSLDGLILAMFDVNGLKQVNDTLGHDAGDELLKGAADCLTAAFSGIGTIYRVGGDEYTGIFHGTAADLTSALQRFHEAERAWQGDAVHRLSVSVGTAAAADHPDTSRKDLETIADDAMYTAKKSYHEAVKVSLP